MDALSGSQPRTFRREATSFLRVGLGNHAAQRQNREAGNKIDALAERKPTTWFWRKPSGSVSVATTALLIPWPYRVERVNYSVQDSSCALENAVPDLGGCPHSTLRDVACRFDGASPSAANQDGAGKSDRDECFHR